MGSRTPVLLFLAGLLLLSACSGTESRTPFSEAVPTATGSAVGSPEAWASPTGISPDAVASPTDPLLEGRSAAIVAELNEEIVPLRTVGVDGPIGDLDPFLDMVGDATIVGLGEATHGTREFMLMHHRVVRALVEQLQFTIVAFEAPAAGIEMVNRYVQGEIVDPAVAREGLLYPSLQNDEVWLFIEWLRLFNQQADTTSIVHVVGIDPQHNTIFAPDIIVDYVATIDSVAADQLRTIYFDVQRLSGSAQSLEQARLAYAMVEGLRTQASSLTSLEAHTAVLRLARSIIHDQQFLHELQMAGGSIVAREAVMPLRDRLMADELIWVADEWHGEARIVLWGHNRHIGIGNYSSTSDHLMLGGHLSEHYGDRYAAVGFDFASGSFTALVEGDSSMPPSTFTTSPLPENTYATIFRQLDASMFLLDLRTVDRSSHAGQWLAEERAMWSVGCCHTGPSTPTIELDLMGTFDVILFVRDTSPTTILTLD